MEGIVIGNDDSLESHGIHLLMGPVDADSCSKAIDWILRNEFSEEPNSKLTLMINSEGGSVSDAFALIDIMQGSSIPINTLGIGEISSCGLMIFMAGKRGGRVVTPNTMIMSHQYSSMSFGKAHELFAAQKGFDLTTDIIMRHYANCTELSDDDIRKYLLPAEDVFLSAKEGLKLGLCDEIKGENK